jgi:ribose transport system ATP-binding protein
LEVTGVQTCALPIWISDRILVMYEGTFYGELTKEEFSEENILRYSIGKSLKQVV